MDKDMKKKLDLKKLWNALESQLHQEIVHPNENRIGPIKTDRKIAKLKSVRDDFPNGSKLRNKIEEVLGFVQLEVEFNKVMSRGTNDKAPDGKRTPEIPFLEIVVAAIALCRNDRGRLFEVGKVLQSVESVEAPPGPNSIYRFLKAFTSPEYSLPQFRTVKAGPEWASETKAKYISHLQQRYQEREKRPFSRQEVVTRAIMNWQERICDSI